MTSISAQVSPRTFVIIPAFNEEASIRTVVEGVLSLGLQVVVVDDGSQDSTVRLIQDLPISILRHCVNLGQGAAIQTGVDYAVSRGARYLVTFDADGQHDEKDILLLVKTLSESQVDVVLGSRFLGTALNISRSRRLILKAGILFTRLTSGLRLTDVHNGLRAFRAEVAPYLRISQRRMAHASEILQKIRKHRLQFIEVPCTVRYTSYSTLKGQPTLGAVDILYDILIRSLTR